MQNFIAVLKAIKQLHIAFLMMSLLLSLMVISSDSFAVDDLHFNKFRKFSQIFEPSGIVQHPDGRFIVIEDESAQSLASVTLELDGSTREKILYKHSLGNILSELNSLNDLEGAAIDDEGFIYAISSHSRTTSGKRNKNRERLIRFKLDGDQVTDFEEFGNLVKRVRKQHPFLKASTKEKDVRGASGFNIEGLSFDQSKQQLLIGLRAPLDDGKAMILTLQNPKEVFTLGEKAQISQKIIRLDLKGGGIRGISYDPYLKSYLIISRQVDKKFKLWTWDGNTQNAPLRVKLPDIKNLRNAEGISPARLADGTRGLMIVSDEGDLLIRKPGRYLFLSYDQLAIQGR